jgi:DNA-binding CsgD family transcriptional regulator
VAEGVRGDAGKSPHPLTERELAVLRLVAQGRTDAEAAAIIGVSERTVSIHRARILTKLGVSTRADAVEWARANGLLGGSGAPE